MSLAYQYEGACSNGIITESNLSGSLSQLEGEGTLGAGTDRLMPYMTTYLSTVGPMHLFFL